ncbi:sodium-dependent transporter [Sutterella seckii]|uniref:Transporter n=1 Tax=Sutterella seckii TaxID=1944635 RepID=A0AAI9SBZ3_9BURK|nr:sodium-dependent transporter [Sutterella seckii]KAB7651197.1 sodium-dependent transporter [Sutterella seckii]
MSTANAAASVQWSSRLGFILASAGSAIGLGAIWKFPFWAGANGGGAFILPYVVFTLTTGLVLLMAEIAIGRRGRGSAVSAMRRIGGRPFAFLGAFAVLTSFLILAYYCVVGGWCVAYLAQSLTVGVVRENAQTLRNDFREIVSTGWINIAWLFSFLSLTALTVGCGIEKGIERVSKLLMPMLFVMMLAVIIRGLTLDGAMEGVKYLLSFRPEDLSPGAILSAMGYTFFSLSLGAGILITYGTYLPKRADIPAASLWVALLSIQASLLAGLMVMPAVFAFGVAPDAGPGLVFITLPMIFAHIPGGSIFAAIFYVCLLVAALTSSVSLLEVVVAFLHNEWRLSRSTATIVSFVLLFFLGSLSALSFGELSEFTLLGRNFFDFFDFVCTNFMMPVGGLAVAALMTWKAWPAMREELTSAKPLSSGMLSAIRVVLGVLAPILVLTTMYQGLFL